MNEDRFKKHSRRTALAAYQDFKIHKTDEILLHGTTLDTESTQLSPIPQSPTDRRDPSLEFKLLETMESISNRLKLQKMCNAEKTRSLKSSLLSLFFHQPSTSRVRAKKSSLDDPKKKSKKMKRPVIKLKSKSVKDLKFFESQATTHRSSKPKPLKQVSINH
jgi:hypothetical protein